MATLLPSGEEAKNLLHVLTNRVTDRQTDRLTDRQTDGRSDRQTDRQTDRREKFVIDCRKLQHFSLLVIFYSGTSTNDHLSTIATFLCPQGGSCGEA